MSDANKGNAAIRQMLQNKPAPLGRGLSALFGDTDAGYQPPAAAAQAPQPAQERAQKQLPVASLQPGRFQPRRHFDASALDELAASIREHGVLQPLLVRPVEGKDKFEIIAGERRWRAAQMAGVHDVPVVVRDLSDADALEIAIIENIQRQDLTALEEAEAYQRLIAEFNHTQEDLSKIVGKSRSHIANTMRLLNLPQPVKQMLIDGAITAGHARALLMAEAPEELAHEIIRDQLSVRAVEARIRKPAPVEPNGGGTVTTFRRGSVISVDANTQALEKELTNALGLKVKLNANADGSGAVTIAYKTLDQLEELLQKIRA